MGQKMKNPPVYFALIQARFNAVLTLDQYIPAIQDAFRKFGYPDFQKQFLATFNFNLAKKAEGETPAAPASLISVPTAKYLFMNADRSSTFVLDPGGLTYQTTHYDTFETFIGSILRGLDFVHKHADLSYTDRLGIRFLDAVVPPDGDDVSKMLAPSVLGMFNKLPDRELVHSVSETRTRAGTTSLISRTVIYKHPAENADQTVAFPPDLDPEPLKLMSKFTNLTGTYGVLDNDCFHENRDAPFDPEKIDKTFRYLKEQIRQSFALMITPDALKIWE